MTERKEESKLRMVGATCESEDISRDAWGDWDVQKLDWVLRTAFDFAHCHAYASETRIREVPV